MNKTKKARLLKVVMTDSDGQPCIYRNHYKCGDCGSTWTSDWSCMCDDDCPNCGSRHWTPVRSDDLEI